MQKPLIRRFSGRLSRAATRAFTLMEVLIALAILALLVGVAISNVGKIFSGAQEDIAKTFVTSSLEVPLQSYRMHMGDYPTTAEGLQALITAPADKASRWRGPYLKGDINSLNDPWKRPYQYRYPGVRNKGSYDVWSKGSDGEDGTTDDIGNWSADATTSTIPGM